MKRLFAGVGALTVWAALVLPASAGWDNVFQPTLFERWRQPTTSSYYVAPVVVAQASPVVVAQSAPCNTCAPQQQCTTNYVQRSYYQPVTVYENRTQYEQVTTQRTSYYYEPVVSYRYSLYVDPCSGCQQQVATPATSYVLKAQTCPVQSWVARCVQVPVTVQQQVSYWQPVTTCCTTTQGAPIYASQPPAVAVPVQQPPLVNPVPAMPQTEQPPSIRGERTPGTGSSNPTSQWEQYYPKLEKAPEIKNISTPGTSWQPQLGNPVPVQTNSPAQPSAPIKFDRIAVGPNSQVEGKVVRNDDTPKGNAKVLFINASTGKRETITTNSGGRFLVELPAGSWHVYLYGNDDLPVHHSRIDVNGSQYRQVNLVSRSN